MALGYQTEYLLLEDKRIHDVVAIIGARKPRGSDSYQRPQSALVPMSLTPWISFSSHLRSHEST